MTSTGDNESCSIHKMPLTRECASHKKRICSGCSVVEHRSCLQLQSSIPLQDFVETVSRVCEVLECHLYMLGKEKQTAENLVKERCGLYREMIDKMEQRSLHDIDKGYNKQASHLREYRTKFECFHNVQSDVKEAESTENDALRSCLTSKLAAMEKDPHISWLCEMADNFLQQEAPAYLLKFKISETFEKTILQRESIGKVATSSLIQPDNDSEKRKIIKDLNFSPRLPPTAPLQYDQMELPTYEELIQDQEAKDTKRAAAALVDSNYSIPAVNNPSPAFNVVRSQPMQALQHGFEAVVLSCGKSVPPLSGQQTPHPHHPYGQYPQDPYEGMSLGRSEFIHPYQQGIVRQQQTQDSLTSFLSAPSGPPKELKILSNIHPRYINEVETVTISGISFLDNGCIVLSDKANCTVKIYDDVNVLLNHRKLEHKPYGVTQAPSGDIAVAVPKEHSVIMLSPHDLSTVPNARINNYKGKCFGLTSTQSHIFVIWTDDDAKESIAVYDENYTEIQKINLSVERTVAVNPSTQDVFYRVLNFGSDQIKCINPFSSTKTKWKVKVPARTSLIEGMGVLKSGILISTPTAVQFLDIGSLRFTQIMKLKHGSHLAINRDRTKVALVIAESISLNEKDDVVGIYNLVY